jgi:hypothetical protein
LRSTAGLASTIPFEGISTNTGSGNPVLIDRGAGAKLFGALNTLFCFTG